MTNKLIKIQTVDKTLQPHRKERRHDGKGDVEKDETPTQDQLLVFGNLLSLIHFTSTFSLFTQLSYQSI